MEDARKTDVGLYDLLFLTDATGSMGSFLHALRQCLPDIIRVSSLTDCFSRIGVLAYRDYDRCTDYDGTLTEWSGWHAPGDPALSDVSQPALITFTSQLRADLGGGAEAAKTGLARAHSVMRPEATTIIVLFADQPPHLPWDSSIDRLHEIEHLSKPGTFGGSGPLFLDWISAARTLGSGDRKARVFAYVDCEYSAGTLPSFLHLCNVTGGACFRRRPGMRNSVISDVVVSILVSWMGLAGSGDEDVDFGGESVARGPVLATRCDWADPSAADTVEDEDSDRFHVLFRRPLIQDSVFARSDIQSLSHISSFASSREPPLQHLSKRYAADPSYRIFATAQLNHIINADVRAIATNPIFGSLWRAVSSDRSNPGRHGLITNFSLQVDRITDEDDRARMKAWLDESYDFTASILETLGAVSDTEKFPCVYLDPTQAFSGTVGDPASRRLSSFKRAELLEIGRSCDPAILRRLGKVLTQLSFAASEHNLPTHIREADVLRIPMALALERHGRQFWKVLLHLIVPGTRLSARPAALLAALSNRMDMLPLRAAADEELLACGGSWVSLETPETWSLSCLSLLLDADRDYESRVAEGVTTRPAQAACVLTTEERGLFQTLVDYKMLEFNLETTLAAKVGWTPSKTKEAMGPAVVCVRCRIPRSVTIMAAEGVCGLCATLDCRCETCKAAPDPAAAAQDRLHANASETDDERTLMAWVECANNACRSQYVVYNVNNLGIDPKCHYCRLVGGNAPFVECTQCLNRIIWPLEYRPEGMAATEYRCTACANGRETVVSCDTTAKQLSAENGTGWLIRNDAAIIKGVFDGRSIFHTAKTSDLQAFAAKVAVLPRNDALRLTLRGKAVRNGQEVVASLAGWVSRRHVEEGTCSLCCSDLRKADLRSACERKGCLSRVCGPCRRGWYGLNARGRILNLAALCCPFCRRRPSPRSMPREIAHLGGLGEAVKDDAWIWAWCSRCGFAKRHMERVCANGAPRGVEAWQCEECESKGRVALDVRQCPGCDVATQKLSGCDHISCPCGTHWCYECGKACAEFEIYEHMSAAHGGLYGGRAFEDGDDDDWDF